MPEMSGTILYVNAPRPGQRSGSLKFDNNERIGILANQMHLFQRGQQVSVVYKDRAGSDGRWWKDFVSFTGEGQPPNYPAPPPNYMPPQPAQVSRPAAPRPPSPPPPTPQNRPRAPGVAGHDYNTGKQICVTGITQRFVQAGTTPVTDIPVVMRTIAQAYDDIFNPQPQPVRLHPTQQYIGQPAGPRDEIPPFDDQVDDIGYERDEDPNRPPF